MRDKIIGVYKFTSPIGHIYIGKSTDCLKRKNSNYNRQRLIKSSFDLHGKHNHTFEIIEVCTIENIDDREKYWVDFYNTCNTHHGLNCTTGGGVKFDFSSETKKIIKSIVSGNTNWVGKKHKQSTKELQSLNLWSAKLVLNLETGIYYKSATEVCELTNLKYDRFTRMLTGVQKNKTSFIYA